MNRTDAQRATYVNDAPITAIISITDVDDGKNWFYPRPWILAIHEQQFNDVIDGNKHCITYEQAKEIAAFAHEYYKRVERIIIHCEYGQSRSAGVAAAISEHFEGHDSGIYTNPDYSPNPTCYSYVREALGKLSLS